MQLDLESHKSLEDLRGFLAGSRDESVLVPGRKAAYAQIGKVLRRFSYWKLGRADKGLVRRYLQRTTGLSRAQLTRLVGRYLREGELRDRRQGAARPFRRKYRARGHPAAGGGGRIARDAVGAGDAQAVRAGVEGVRRRPLRAPGRDLERACV